MHELDGVSFRAIQWSTGFEYRIPFRAKRVFHVFSSKDSVIYVSPNIHERIARLIPICVSIILRRQSISSSTLVMKDGVGENFYSLPLQFYDLLKRRELA